MPPLEDEPPRAEPGQQSIADEILDLYTSARERAGTEWAFRKAQAILAGKWAGMAAALGCAAAGLLFLALMAAVFGLVLALTETVGAWGATGIVAGVFLLLAAAAALAAWRWIGRISTLLRGDGG